MSRLARGTGIALGAFALGGCAMAPAVYEPVHAQNYIDGDFEAATQTGVLRAVIHADPGPLPRDRFNALIAEHIARGSAFGEIHVTTARDGGAHPDYRVVVLFNGPAGIAGYDLCHEEDAAGYATEPFGNGLSMLAAFCYRDVVLSEAGGRIAGVKGPEDARAGRLIGAVTMALQPPYDFWDIGGDSPTIP